MQWVAVLLAAAAGFASGAVWYMTLGERWKVAVGKTDGELEADKSALPFVIGLAASLLTAGLMRHLLASSGVGGLGAGFVAGLGIGLFMVAPWILTNYAFAGRPRALWWIDGGHVVLACTSIGTVLGLFL
jgi:hypothetical protein